MGQKARCPKTAIFCERKRAERVSTLPVADGFAVCSSSSAPALGVSYWAETVSVT